MSKGILLLMRLD